MVIHNIIAECIKNAFLIEQKGLAKYKETWKHEAYYAKQNTLDSRNIHIVPNQKESLYICRIMGSLWVIFYYSQPIGDLYILHILY